MEVWMENTLILTAFLYGRVNFIKNIRYATNPIMDRPSFDKYGEFGFHRENWKLKFFSSTQSSCSD